MAGEDRQLHIFMFPFTAHGHTTPMVDMAKLFASRGVNITIVTTPLNSIFISKSLPKTPTPGEIDLLILNFPYAEVGLPENSELANSILSLDMVPRFFKALSMLEAPLEKALLEKRPHGLIADVLFPWATDVAARAGIPRLVFHGSSSLCVCAGELLALHKPYKHVSSDSEPFAVPYLPGEIKLTKLQIPCIEREDDPVRVGDIFNRAREAEEKSFGVVSNSFYELEPDYADCHINTLRRKVWYLGPVSFYNKEAEGKEQSGTESAIDEHECLKWLNSKKPRSVVFLCFGSTTRFSSDQLKEIAIGLEAAGQQFIWAVAAKEADEGWLPEGFEERTKGKGLIIRGWAPQLLILNHVAVGGFVTHCGWSSVLEAVVAGVPMVTWPMGADQIYNEKIVTQVVKMGVPVGVQKFVGFTADFIESEAIEKAILRIMVGDEGKEMRRRATEVAEKARKAVAEGGSSFSDLSALIEELKSLAF